MLLFRSEEEIDRWSAATGFPRGEAIAVGTLERLAGRWYGDRLAPVWTPHTVEASQAILFEFGLTSEFWRLT
jgi:hypothetical protein